MNIEGNMKHWFISENFNSNIFYFCNLTLTGFSFLTDDGVNALSIHYSTEGQGRKFRALVRR